MRKLIILLTLCIAIPSTQSYALAQATSNYLDASGVVGTDLHQVIPANSGRSFLFVQNVSSANSLAFTIDNTAPGINKPGSFMLAAGASITFATKIPTGVVNIIGNAANTYYTVKYEN